MTSAPGGHAAFFRLDRAVRDGDLVAIRREVGDLPGFPDVAPHQAMGSILVYAIDHGPVHLVRELLAAGADPDWSADDDGFPPLIAAITCNTDAPGSPRRLDVVALVELLLGAGADVDQRDPNDFTPLHLAAQQGDLELTERLLAAGADPAATTRIDDRVTPLAAAARAGHDTVVERLRSALDTTGDTPP